MFLRSDAAARARATGVGRVVVVPLAVLVAALAGTARAATPSVDLGTLGRPFSGANVVNASGQVIGGRTITAEGGRMRSRGQRPAAWLISAPSAAPTATPSGSDTFFGTGRWAGPFSPFTTVPGAGTRSPALALQRQPLPQLRPGGSGA